MPSTFAENLDPDSFEDVHEYPVATAQEKAVEVYLRLVVGAQFVTALTIMVSDDCASLSHAHACTYAPLIDVLRM